MSSTRDYLLLTFAYIYRAISSKRDQSLCLRFNKPIVPNSPEETYVWDLQGRVDGDSTPLGLIANGLAPSWDVFRLDLIRSNQNSANNKEYQRATIAQSTHAFKQGGLDAVQSESDSTTRIHVDIGIEDRCQLWVDIGQDGSILKIFAQLTKAPTDFKTIPLNEFNSVNSAVLHSVSVSPVLATVPEMNFGTESDVQQQQFGEFVKESVSPSLSTRGESLRTAREATALPMSPGHRTFNSPKQIGPNSPKQTTGTTLDQVVQARPILGPSHLAVVDRLSKTNADIAVTTDLIALRSDVEKLFGADLAGVEHLAIFIHSKPTLEFDRAGVNIFGRKKDGSDENDKQRQKHDQEALEMKAAEMGSKRIEEFEANNHHMPKNWSLFDQALFAREMRHRVNFLEDSTAMRKVDTSGRFKWAGSEYHKFTGSPAKKDSVFVSYPDTQGKDTGRVVIITDSYPPIRKYLDSKASISEFTDWFKQKATSVKEAIQKKLPGRSGKSAPSPTPTPFPTPPRPVPLDAPMYPPTNGGAYANNPAVLNPIGDKGPRVSQYPSPPSAQGQFHPQRIDLPTHGSGIVNLNGQYYPVQITPTFAHAGSVFTDIKHVWNDMRDKTTKLRDPYHGAGEMSPDHIQKMESIFIQALANGASQGQYDRWLMSQDVATIRQLKLWLEHLRYEVYEYDVDRYGLKIPLQNIIDGILKRGTSPNEPDHKVK